MNSELNARARFAEGMKRCSKCGEVKAVAQFHKRNGGVGSWCKSCHTKASSQNYYAKRTEKLEQMKAYRDENKEKVRAAIKKAHGNNPEGRRKWARNWICRHRAERQEWEKGQRSILSDGYVKHLLVHRLGIPLAACTSELIESKRTSMIAYRAWTEGSKILNERNRNDKD